MKIRTNIQWSAELNQPRSLDTSVGYSQTGYVPIAVPANRQTEVWRIIRALQRPDIRTAGRTTVGKLQRTYTEPDNGCNAEPNMRTLQCIAK